MEAIIEILLSHRFVAMALPDPQLALAVMRDYILTA
jgi:hypothetical protein